MLPRDIYISTISSHHGQQRVAMLFVPFLLGCAASWDNFVHTCEIVFEYDCPIPLLPNLIPIERHVRRYIRVIFYSVNNKCTPVVANCCTPERAASSDVTDSV